jgi:hypothetical protein
MPFSIDMTSAQPLNTAQQKPLVKTGGPTGALVPPQPMNSLSWEWVPGNPADAVRLVTGLLDATASASRLGASRGASGAAQGFYTAPPQYTSDPRAQKAQEDTVQALNERIPAARELLARHGAMVAPNEGQGMNCLILSLLQHATSNYRLPDQRMVDTANQIRADLHLGDGMLLADDPDFKRLVDHINKRHPSAQLNVTVSIPFSAREFVSTGFDNGRPNHVVILQGGSHYEAVTMAPVPVLRQPLVPKRRRSSDSSSGPSSSQYPPPSSRPRRGHG